MKSLAPLALIAGLASLTCAQSASITWLVSTDGGVTWSSATSGPIYRGGTVWIRAVAFWSIPNSLGLAGIQFDAEFENAISQDTFSNITRPVPFNVTSQSLVASTYSGGMKIDAAGDTSEPGLGAGWITASQRSRDESGTSFNSNAPVVVFSCTALFTGDYERYVFLGSTLNPAAGEGFSVYTSASGARSAIDASAVNVNTAVVWFIPSPGASSFLGMCCALATRRRR